MGIDQRRPRSGTWFGDYDMNKDQTFLACHRPHSCRAGPAHAHATFETDSAHGEPTVNATLQVPHAATARRRPKYGCRLPEGFVFAKPQPKPGWELRSSRATTGRPMTITAPRFLRPLEIRWKGGNLPDEHYAPSSCAGNSRVSTRDVPPFRRRKLCGADGKVVWDQVAAEGQDAHSSSIRPTITVTMATGGDEQLRSRRASSVRGRSVRSAISRSRAEP